jgi:hypothetical protein
MLDILTSDPQPRKLNERKKRNGPTRQQVDSTRWQIRPHFYFGNKKIELSVEFVIS